MDGELIPIRSPLRNGSVVEIVRGKSPAPKQDWLDSVRTSRAREKIRRYLAEQDSAVDPTTAGRTMLEDELRRRGAATQLAFDEAFLARLAQLAHRDSVAELLTDLSSGRLRASGLRGLPARVVTTSSDDPATTPAGPAGLTGLPFTIARCCNPTSRDETAGFISAARVVSVHRADCSNYLAMVRALPPGEVGRLLPLRASHETPRAFVEVEAADRQGLLSDLAAGVTGAGAGIVASTTDTRDGRALLRFELDVVDDEHLSAVMGAMGSVTGVVAVTSSGTGNR